MSTSKRRIVQLALLLLLTASSAWADDGTRHPRARQAADAVEQAGGDVWRRVAAAPSEEGGMALGSQHQAAVAARLAAPASNQMLRRQARQRRLDQQQQQQQQQEAQAAAAPTADLAQITPAPCLLQARQDDGQIQALSQQIASISSVASSVSQASRQVSQSSQQLSQSVQQLTQSTQQLSQSVRDLQQSVQQAQESARQASQSADQAVRQARESASSAMQVLTSGAAATMSSVLAAASSSARELMVAASSQVRIAQADATLARQNAATQVEQAQGAAVSVTQAALAVVGTFIGTVLLTIAVFWLLLKRREKKKKKASEQSDQRRRDVSYPRRQSSSSSSGGHANPFASSQDSLVRYQPDIKEKLAPPEPVMTPAGSGFGVAQSDYSVAISGPGGPGVTIGNPPAARTQAPAGTSFSLFPRKPSAGTADSRPGAAQEQRVPSEAFSPSSQYSQDSNAVAAAPSLQKWLGASTVSPFGTLNSNKAAVVRTESPGWPLQRPQGVGGVNAGGGAASGGKVMRPLSKLPLRDS